VKRFDLWSGAVLFALGIAVSLESLNLGLGSWTIPGPGFLSCGAGLALSLVSLGFFSAAVVRKDPSSEKFWSFPHSWKVFLMIVLSLCIYNLVWTRLGFFVSTFLLLAFLFGIVGKQRWPVSLIGAVLISAAAYLLFGVFLETQLPTGVMGF